MKKLALPALVLVPLFALAGCTASPQTVDEACEIVMSDVSKLDSSLSSIEPGDTQAAVEGLNELSAQLEETGERITNDEVFKEFDAFHNALNNFTETLSNIEDVTQSVEAYDELVVSYGTLSLAGERLSSVCA